MLSQPETHPFLALLNAAVARQVSAVPPVALPGGHLDVSDVQLQPDGVTIQMAGKSRLGLHTKGSVHVRVTSVGTDHAFLSVGAEGGMAFRAAVHTAMAAGGLLEPLLRSLLGRPLRQGITMQGGQVRLSYAPLVDSLPDPEV